MQQFDSLVSPALVNIQQTELHQAVGDQIVVEPDLLLTKHIQMGNRFLQPKKLSVHLSRFPRTPKVNLELPICPSAWTFTGRHPLTHSY